MSMISQAIRHPVATIAAVILVVMFGIVSLYQLPVQLTPDVEQPQIHHPPHNSDAMPPLHQLNIRDSIAKPATPRQTANTATGTLNEHSHAHTSNSETHAVPHQTTASHTHIEHRVTKPVQ